MLLIRQNDMAEIDLPIDCDVPPEKLITLVRVVLLSLADG